MTKKKTDTRNYQHPPNPHFWCELRGFIEDEKCKQCFNTNELFGDFKPQERPYCQQLQRELEYRRGEKDG